jgi:putative ATP-dependent endonuclease of OLD family
MRILTVAFHNFRALRDVEIPFGKQTVLVGPNNVGKTSVLQGLEYSLGVGRRSYGFDEDDVTAGVDRQEGFEIRIAFGPSDGTVFGSDEVELFGTDIDTVDDEDRLFVVVSGKAEDDGVFRSRCRFAKSDGLTYGSVPEPERRALGILVLPAVREARHEMADRGGLWARLGAEGDLTDEAQSKLDLLSAELGSTVVAEVLGKDAAKAVSERVASLVSSVLFAGKADANVTYGAVPIDASQALRQIELRLTTPEDTRSRRVGDHSVGTQSVAMFGLFSAYADKLASRIVALGVEEPEAHLHPHAIRSLVRSLLASDSQVILTTHSSEVLDATDPRRVVRLRRTAGGTVAYAAARSDIDEWDLKWIQRTIAELGSDFMFSRAVLLTEGESEHLALPVLARQMGVDFDVLGVTVVTIHGSHFGSFAKLLGLDGLNIPFARLCDKDKATAFVKGLIKSGQLPRETAEDDLVTTRPVAAGNGHFWWSVGDFEECLMTGGGLALYVDALVELYGADVFKNHANGAKVELPANPAESGFLHSILKARGISKPLANLRVAELFAERGIEPPAEVREVVEHVAALAIAEALAGIPAIAEDIEESGAASEESAPEAVSDPDELDLAFGPETEFGKADADENWFDEMVGGASSAAKGPHPK